MSINKAILKNLQLVITFSAIIFIAGSCNFSKKTLGNGDKWIPADFNPNKMILLVEEYNWLRKFKEEGIHHQESYLTAHYPYKYELVPLSVIKERNGKYADTKLYKYALVSYRNSSAVTKSGGASTNTGVISDVNYDFNFYDRANDTDLQPTNKSQGPYKQTFQVVINTIEKHFAEK